MQTAQNRLLRMSALITMFGFVLPKLSFDSYFFVMFRRHYSLIQNVPGKNYDSLASIPLGMVRFRVRCGFLVSMSYHDISFALLKYGNSIDCLSFY